MNLSGGVNTKSLLAHGEGGGTKMTNGLQTEDKLQTEGGGVKYELTKHTERTQRNLRI